MPNALAPRAAACASLQHLHFQTAHAAYPQAIHHHLGELNLTDDESNTRVRRDHSTVNQTVPGATLYGEVELYVNRTDTAFATGSKNLRKIRPLS